MGDAGDAHVYEGMPPFQGSSHRLGIQVSCQYQECKNHRRDGHIDLGGHHQFAAVYPVRQNAGPRADDEDRKGTDAHDGPGQKGIAVGEMQHQAANRKNLDPLRSDREEITDPEIPEVRVMGDQPETALPSGVKLGGLDGG